MFLEYIHYVYNHLLRFPKRFITIVIGVGIATFGILSLFSMTSNLYHQNQHVMVDIENTNINHNQFWVQSQTLDHPLDLEQLKKILSFDEVDKGYYFEDFSYYLWQYNFLLPWIQLANKINLELKPILIDIASAKDYGLGDKIIAGRFFSSDTNEIILSTDLLNRFMDENIVFKDNYIILPESTRQDLKSLNNKWLDFKDFIGKRVIFTYRFQFEIDKSDAKNIRYKFSNPISIPLTIVGIYDPAIGYQTVGDVWLPLTLKEQLNGLNTSSSINQMGRELSIHITKADQIDSAKDKISKLGLFVVPTVEEEPFVVNQLLQRNVQQIFYLTAFVISVIISLISLIVAITLMISERKYDFYLQRALGASNKQILIFFSSETFFSTLIGSLVGLLFTLLFLQSKFDTLLALNFYLSGNIASIVVLIIPLASVVLAAIELHYTLKVQVSLGLAREE